MRSCSQPFLGLLLLVVLAGSLTSCSLLSKILHGDGNKKKEDPGARATAEEEAKEKQAPSHRVAGEIVSVHADEGFVLIRLFAHGGGIGDGDLVGALSPTGTTSSLQESGERLGRWYAADIQEGTPAKGDLVTVRRLAESAKPASTPLPEAQKSDSGRFWEKNIPAPGL